MSAQRGETVEDDVEPLHGINHVSTATGKARRQ